MIWFILWLLLWGQMQNLYCSLQREHVHSWRLDSQIGSFMLYVFISSLIKSLHGRYLQIMEAEGFEISQPALDPTSQDIHHGITRRQPAKRAHKYEPHVYYFCFKSCHLQDFLVSEDQGCFYKGYMTICTNPQQVLADGVEYILFKKRKWNKVTCDNGD